MLLLTSTSDKIQVITTGTANIDVHVSWADYVAPSTVTPGRTNTKISTAATTDIVASPAASTARNVKTLHVTNVHASTANGVTVQHTDGTNVVQLISVTLNAGERLRYVEGQGFGVFDASGILKANAVTIAGQSIVARLAADVTNSTTTAAKITGLDTSCGIGTWMFDYYVLYTSGTAGTGIKWGVNHSGTVTSFVQNSWLVTANITGADAAADQDVLLTTGGLISAWAARAKSTSAPMISASVDTITSDMLLVINGLCIVTAAGNLELYHASETAVLTTLKAGSSLRLTKTA